MPKGIYLHKPLSEKTKEKMRQSSHRGSDHWAWKGGQENNLPFCKDCNKKLSCLDAIYCRKCSAKEERNNCWKGQEVGYIGLHNWVKKNLGQPQKCEHCDKDGLTGRQIHWANKDHLYKRNLIDWIRLCASCHKIYDFKNHLSNKGSRGGSILNKIYEMVRK